MQPSKVGSRRRGRTFVQGDGVQMARLAAAGMCLVGLHREDSSVMVQTLSRTTRLNISVSS